MCLLCFYRFFELPEAVSGDFLLNGRCDGMSRTKEIFVLLFSNLLEDFGTYQYCGNMLWQVRASVLNSYRLYVITYTFMMLVSCK